MELRSEVVWKAIRDGRERNRLSPQEIVDAEIGARRFFGVRIVGRQ